VKILVFGAGALGSFFGGLLSKHNDVTLIARRDHVDSINSQGLVIEGKTNLIARPKAFVKVPEEDFDLILLTVKSYDTMNCVKEMSAKLSKDTIMLSLQNGLGNLEEISGYFERVIGGATSHGITFVKPGNIFHAGLGYTTLGNFNGVGEEEVEDVCELFNSSGIETRKSLNIVKEIWAKAVINTSINPLTAITGLRNGNLIEIDRLEKMMLNACKEAVEVAVSNGIELDYQEMLEKTGEVARMTADNKSSMLQDIENGKRTEIDSITGVFVETGIEKDIPTPVNSLLFNLVKGIEMAKSS
jgi:2-dehydropantoate 2-reductase